VAKKRKKLTDADEIPSVRRAQELYEKGMAELMARQGVSSVEELKMSPEARRLHELHVESVARRRRSG
jgi:hypothetical protein